MEDNIKSAEYWNKSLPIDSRVLDLLSRMTLEEKAGQLFQTVTMVGPNGTLAPAQPFFNLSSTEDLLSKKFLTHFNLMGQVEDARTIALWHNNLQHMCASTRDLESQSHFQVTPEITLLKILGLGSKRAS
jgi:hypothetical protein